MNEIFYEFKEVKSQADLTSNVEIEIILHFLSKLEEFLALFETKFKISKSSTTNSDEDVINELQKIFLKVDPTLTLVKGKIREIFLSYSS
jgi:hypothetical protein